FVAIVGPSGSGKYTLMNMLGCLDTATEGEYILDGRNISGCNDNQLAEIRNCKIGFVFQKYNLLPKLTAIENVELPLIYQGKGTRERRKMSIDALTRLGLGTRLSSKPSELSGGQQQRVSIARALVTNPPVILADEPTGALDSKTGKEVLQILKELHDSGNTIILITHDLDIAQKAERIVKIQDGKIVSDTSDEYGESQAV
ncbi:MAG: ABC transporter ATP-binding protein, partial [Bacillota bacterium]|nr:ABC transporter ATP-binding protein [Bacillota bacterium]